MSVSTFAINSTVSNQSYDASPYLNPWLAYGVISTVVVATVVGARLLYRCGENHLNQTYCNGNAQPRQGDFRAAQPNTLDLPEIRHV
jgi:hypothetical protein